MTVTLSALAGAGQQFFDNSGNMLSGGKLWSYAAGTTTPQTTYTTAAGTVAHTNPIILDSAGRVPSGQIWLTSGENYKFVLMTSVDVVLASYDNIVGNGDPAFTFYNPATSSLLAPGPLTIKSALDQITDEDSGSSVIGYLPPFTNAERTDVGAKFAQNISVKDFGATGDGVTDDTTAIQNTIDYVFENGGVVFFPSGIYIITDTIGKIGNSTDWRHYASFPSLVGVSHRQVKFGVSGALDPTLSNTNSVDSIIYYKGATGKPAIHFGCAVGVNGESFAGGEIRHITVIGPKQDAPESDNTTGIFINGCYGFRVLNIGISRFSKGFHNNFSYSASLIGIEATRNDVGILLTDNSNALHLIGIQAHQNKIGIRVRGGSNWSVNGATVEGQQHGIMVDSDGSFPRPIGSISNVYGEKNTVSFLQIGIDRDGNDSSDPVTVSLKDVSYLGGVGGVLTQFIKYGNAIDCSVTGTFPDGFTNVITTNAATINLRTDVISNFGQAFVVENNAYGRFSGNRFPFNLFPNGAMKLGGLDLIKQSALNLGVNLDPQYVFDATLNRNVLRISLPDGLTSSIVFYTPLVTDERFTEAIVAQAFWKRDADCSLEWRNYDSAGNALSGIMSVGTDWATAQVRGNIPADGKGLFTRWLATNNSGVTKYVYIDAIVANFISESDVIPSPFDAIAGLSGSNVTDVSGEIIVNTRELDGAPTYNVLATVQSNHFAVLRVSKGTGGFTIKAVDATGANVSGVTVAYFIMPLYATLGSLKP